MKTIELTDQEIQVLANLLNEAVKAKGLETAESALFFLKKLQTAKNAEVRNESNPV